MTHELKTWPVYFQEVWNRNKKFELRKHDRPYQVGDTLILLEYEPTKAEYTGRKIFAEIGYIFSEPVFGLKDGYCILSLLKITI